MVGQGEAQRRARQNRPHGFAARSGKEPIAGDVRVTNREFGFFKVCTFWPRECAEQTGKPRHIRPRSKSQLARRESPRSTVSHDRHCE
jgi:hypothetical protein